jgi:hypothetical protein
MKYLIALILALTAVSATHDYTGLTYDDFSAHYGTYNYGGHYNYGGRQYGRYVDNYYPGSGYSYEYAPQHCYGYNCGNIYTPHEPRAANYYGDYSYPRGYERYGSYWGYPPHHRGYNCYSGWC